MPCGTSWLPPPPFFFFFFLGFSFLRCFGIGNPGVSTLLVPICTRPQHVEGDIQHGLLVLETMLSTGRDMAASARRLILLCTIAYDAVVVSCPADGHKRQTPPVQAAFGSRHVIITVIVIHEIHHSFALHIESLSGFEAWLPRMWELSPQKEEKRNKKHHFGLSWASKEADLEHECLITNLLLVSASKSDMKQLQCVPHRGIAPLGIGAC